MGTTRVNFNMDDELLAVLDAYAAFNNRTRTYVLHELLMPSLPALKHLLSLSEDLKGMTDSERLLALSKLEASIGDLTKGSGEGKE